MKLLLDTHIVLWYISDDSRLSEEAKAWINNGENEVYYSLVSVWEVAIKRQIGTRKMPLSDEEFVAYAEESNMNCLTLTKDHIAALKTLALKEAAKEHHDPFDRMLICQAKAENMLFMTHDQLLQGYGEPCVLLV